MALLLDTHALIWALFEPVKLPETLRADLENPRISVCFSSISALEMSVKIPLGKLTLDLAQALSEAEKVGFEEVPFRSKHAQQMLELPAIHTDPFDRALIAQAICDGFTFVTRDETIRNYPLSQRWK